MFEMKAQMDTILFEFKKQQLAEEQEEKISIAPGKANANLMKTIKSVVEQEMSDKLRTLSIENERLREAVKKTNDLYGAQESKIKNLETKVKKLETQDKAERITESKFKALEQKVAGLVDKWERLSDRVQQIVDVSEKRVKIISEKWDKDQEINMRKDQRLQELETWKEEHNSFHGRVTQWIL